MSSFNESELILDLIKDISNELDVKSLCHKILQNVGILTESDRCSLFLVTGDSETNSQYLVSNLFDVSSSSTVEEVGHKSLETAPVKKQCNLRFLLFDVDFYLLR